VALDARIFAFVAWGGVIARAAGRYFLAICQLGEIWAMGKAREEPAAARQARRRAALWRK